MVQIEVEVVGVNVECVTQDGGVLAQFQHPNTTTTTSNSNNNSYSGSTSATTGPRPQVGDIAIVSYILSHRGHVLLDLRQPHEVTVIDPYAHDQVKQEMNPFGDDDLASPHLPPGMWVGGCGCGFEYGCVCGCVCVWTCV